MASGALQTRDRSSPRRSRISAGMSARAVAAELTKRKIKTPAGGT
jgi:hypothetical protein